MEMVLLDWTRMGHSYCLAGVVTQGGSRRVVRPLLAKNQDAAVRNFGWSACLLDGHQRWEVFELIGATSAVPEAPHLEDCWVRALRPCGRSATPEQRRQILDETRAGTDEPAFGVALTKTKTAAYLQPGTGLRSLVTVVVATGKIVFDANWRDGVERPDYRVGLYVPGLDGRPLPLKDHHLLLRAERASPRLEDQVQALHQAVGQMGDQVAVRLGLSRPFQATPHRGPGFCWLMVDGFYSLTDPQP